MIITEVLVTGIIVKSGVVTIVGGTIRALWRSWSQQIGTYVVGSYIETARPEFTSAVRQNLAFTPVKGFRAGIVSNHAHPDEADLRCQATTTLSRFIKDFNAKESQRNEEHLPLRRYDVSTSSREAKFDVDGDRLIYGDADLGSAYRYDALKPNHVVTMIDVDYYLKDFSRYANNPIMIYTAIPQNISGRINGTTFRYTGPSSYVETTAGGAEYPSSLWDYSPDLVRIDRKIWGIPVGFTIMKVEKISQPLPRKRNAAGEDSEEDDGKTTPSNRYIVSLVPKVRSWIPYWMHRSIVWVTGMSYAYGTIDKLKRVNNVQQVGPYLIGRFAPLVKRKVGTTMVKTPVEMVQVRVAESTSPERIDINEELFQALCVQAKTAKNFVLGDTSRIVDDGMGEKRLTACKKTLLHDCVKELVGSPNNIYKLRINYQCVPEGAVIKYDPLNRIKPTAKLVGEPLVSDADVAVSPVRSHTNDVACVQGRVLDVANDVVPPEQIVDYAKEFVKIVASRTSGNPYKYKNFVDDEKRKFNYLHPVHLSEVDAKQNLPNQRKRREEDDKHAARKKNKVKSFQKNESYGKTSDPRNISTVTTAQTRELSCFAYAASDQLKGMFGPGSNQGKWMLPGSKPEKIASAVHSFVRTHKGDVIETDYSRFDGTISEWLRVNVEFAVLRAMFAKVHLPELDRLLQGEINQSASTSHGVQYNTGGSRLSGSPLTTLGNTLINAFIAYCGLRMSGKEPKAAMRFIGPKYGDDGIDYNCRHIKEAADLCGLRMKIIKHDTVGMVGFLGRIFPDALNHNGSYFDVPRALKKIPVVANGSAGPELGLARKLAGFLASDPTTPVLSNYCRALQRIHGFDPGHQFTVTRSEERFLELMRSPWPGVQGVDNCQMTDGAIADQLRLTVEEMISLDQKLEQVTTAEGLLMLQFENQLSAENPAPNVHFFDE